MPFEPVAPKPSYADALALIDDYEQRVDAAVVELRDLVGLLVENDVAPADDELYDQAFVWTSGAHDLTGDRSISDDRNPSVRASEDAGRWQRACALLEDQLLPHMRGLAAEISGREQ